MLNRILSRLGVRSRSSKQDVEEKSSVDALREEKKDSEMVSRWDQVTKFVSAITPIITVGLLAYSSYLAAASYKYSLRKDESEKLGSIISKLSDKVPTLRMSATSSLGVYLLRTKNPEEEQEIYAGLLGQLAEETDPVIRVSMSNVFESIDSKSLNVEAIRALLKFSVSESRALVSAGNLRAERIFGNESNIPPGSVEARASAIAHVIQILVRTGARVDLSGIYCRFCDFSKIDLSSASFRGSILADASFLGSGLKYADFSDADLMDSSFIGIDGTHAHFTVGTHNKFFDPVFLFIQPGQKQREGQLQFQMPDFSCAKLQDSDFTGFPLMHLDEDSLWGHRVVLPLFIVDAAFQYADLTNAGFEHAREFGFIPAEFDARRANYPIPPDPTEYPRALLKGTALIDNIERPYSLYLARMDTGSIPKQALPWQFDSSKKYFLEMTKGANLYAARIPDEVRSWLEPTAKPSSESDIARNEFDEGLKRERDNACPKLIEDAARIAEAARPN